LTQEVTDDRPHARRRDSRPTGSRRWWTPIGSIVRPIHERAAGLLAHYVLVDRDAGRVQIVGVWDSSASVATIADELEPARQRLWDAFGESPALAIYEVADVIERRS
jgi:hypothetical protein